MAVASPQEIQQITQGESGRTAVLPVMPDAQVTEERAFQHSRELATLLVDGLDATKHPKAEMAIMEDEGEATWTALADNLEDLTRKDGVRYIKLGRYRDTEVSYMKFYLKGQESQARTKYAAALNRGTLDSASLIRDLESNPNLKKLLRYGEEDYGIDVTGIAVVNASTVDELKEAKLKEQQDDPYVVNQLNTTIKDKLLGDLRDPANAGRKTVVVLPKANRSTFLPSGEVKSIVDQLKESDKGNMVVDLTKASRP